MIKEASKYRIKINDYKYLIATVNLDKISDIEDNDAIDAYMKDHYPNQKYEVLKLKAI